MITASEKRTAEFTTGNKILNAELSLLTEKELEKLADYARYLRWSRIDDDDSDWADAPLTVEEEAQLERGRENARNGKYLTLAEFKESQKCGQ